MLLSYRLKRVPQDTSLQAWNAADELFLAQKKESINGKILLINDQFGALAIALHSNELFWWNNSAMSKEALLENCLTNKLHPPVIVPNVENIDKLDCVVMHIPKSTNLLAWQLEQASKCLTQNGKIFLLGMVKHISTGHINVMNALFENVNPGRSVKKARVIELERPIRAIKSKNSIQTASQLETSLVNLPGSFAEKTIDQGAQVFIDHFDQLPSANNILDLGCGNGILTIAYLKKHQPKKITLIDENDQALKSAQINLETTSSSVQLHFIHSNSLNGLPDQTFELIICNPPFHQENTITEKIAEKMIKDVANALEKNGEFWLVANRHLNYYSILKSLFSDVKVKSKHSKFNVFCCRH